MPDPTSPSGNSAVTVVDVAADGYRLRLVDHPAAFDREGFYGDATGDYADNAWRFGLFCRAALEAVRADGRPLDVLHLHDWHTGPAAIFATTGTRTTRSSVARRSSSPCTTWPTTAGRRGAGSASSA